MHHRTWRGPPPARIIDGSPQWAYKGMPLYTYVKDVRTGDKNGDGVGGVWKGGAVAPSQRGSAAGTPAATR